MTRRAKGDNWGRERKPRPGGTAAIQQALSKAKAKRTAEPGKIIPSLGYPVPTSDNSRVGGLHAQLSRNKAKAKARITLPKVLK